MMTRGCRREGDVQRAAASGRWPAELAGHRTICVACDEVARVTEALAAPLPGPGRLVDPLVLLARARQARRLRAEARISRLLAGAQIAACVVLFCAMAAFALRPAFWQSGGWTGSDWAMLYGATGLLTLGAAALSRLLWRDVRPQDPL